MLVSGWDWTVGSSGCSLDFVLDSHVLRAGLPEGLTRKSSLPLTLSDNPNSVDETSTVVYGVTGCLRLTW